MFEFITRSLAMAGKHQACFKKGMFWVFIKDFALLISFSAVYLGFVNMENMTRQKLGLIVVILVFSFCFNFLANWFLNKNIAGVFFTIYKDYRLNVGERLKTAPMGYFNEQSLSKILACFTNIIKNLENFSQMAVIFIISGASVSFFILIGMFFMNIKMGMLALVLVIVAWLFVNLLFHKMKAVITEGHQIEAEFNDALVNGIRGVSVLRTFPNIDKQHEKEIHGAVYRTTDAVKEIYQRAEMIFTVYAKIFNAFLGIASLLMSIYACLLFTNAEIELAQALTLCVASFMLFSGLKQLGDSAILMVKNPAHLDYLNEVLDIPKLKDGELKALPTSDISFNKVSFAYDKKAVLKDINFAIKAGSKTAIVGPSGSGKTTIINLIARFYDIEQGEITIGGNNIKDYKVDVLLKDLSLVFQDVYLFNDTIKNNIRFAKPDATDEEIIAAAKRAMCHDFISAMPDGYESIVGEGGSSLSGGEKQRISIARALLKDANIVLLDEATSSVDPENEYEIMTAISELCQGKTVISIAHRLSTVKSADQILVISDGELVQIGKHDELIEKEGIYQNFIKAREKAVEWEL